KPLLFPGLLQRGFRAFGAFGLHRIPWEFRQCCGHIRQSRPAVASPDGQRGVTCDFVRDLLGNVVPLRNLLEGMAPGMVWADLGVLDTYLPHPRRRSRVFTARGRRGLVGSTLPFEMFSGL